MTVVKYNTEPLATTQDFPIVGIGASAGGLDAFKRLLKAIPEDSGMAYVLVQHLDPTHNSILPEILSRVTKIPVNEITDDIHLAPDHIYVIPENKILTSVDGVLKLAPRDARKKNFAIDLFFTSLAEVHQNLAVGIVLSGTGSDGTFGLKAIKEYGGITMAQEPESAEHNGMPLRAIQSGNVDFIILAEDMPAKLMEIKQQFHNVILNEETENFIEIKDDEQIRLILTFLRIRKKVDFTLYKKTTIRRRIIRRMSVNKVITFADYLHFLKQHKHEQDSLYSDLLICVTSFFRDVKSFDFLRNTVIPELIERKQNGGSIRIWVAGCATGEEAYTMAICIQEYLRINPMDVKIQIFATDISVNAITKARTGIYETSETNGLSELLLNRYFTKTGNTYLINKTIRGTCVFAHHNMLKDPPFAKMDIISCRNVLIYMEPVLQKKVLGTFHYALNEKGVLMLGKSETPGQSAESFFTVLAKHEKVYVKKLFSVSIKPPIAMQAIEKPEPAFLKTQIKVVMPVFQKTADDIMLARYTPAGVVIDEQFDIVQFRGSTGKWLEPSPGKANFNLLRMAKEGLSFELRNILHKAKTANGPIKKECIDIVISGRHESVTIEAIPLPDINEQHYLVLFQDVSPLSNVSEKETDIENNSGHHDKKDVRDLKIDQLEKELLLVKDDMRSITEEQEAANEELQSGNEELLSGTEELQSLNEELETSQEELQSTNEELTSLNSELQERNEQLLHTNNYAKAIVDTVHDPLLILDKDLRVKSATKAYYAKFNITERELTGHYFYELDNCPWNSKELLEKLKEVAMNKSSFSDFGISCNFKDEGQRILNINARYVEHIDGELILISIEDVTHHRQEKDVLEALVAERTQRLSETIDELKNSNQNLKEFAYAASHDLQEPLRKIQTFSGILSGKADLPLEHKILVEKISTSSTRMRLLIYDLLLFSSLEKTETFMSPVDLSVVLTDVVNDFELLIKEKGAVIEIDNLPVIEAVQLQMNQLFFNLLSNALKFSNPGIKPRISLKVEKITHQEVARYIPLPFLFSTYSKFIFSDNGIGLDTRFSEQIFEVFKRLHGKEAYQGSGIGLALCRRVVTNHNGHLYVVSEEGKGTAFHIILPDRQHATQTLLSSEVTYN